MNNKDDNQQRAAKSLKLHIAYYVAKYHVFACHHHVVGAPILNIYFFQRSTLGNDFVISRDNLITSKFCLFFFFVLHSFSSSFLRSFFSSLVEPNDDVVMLFFSFHIRHIQKKIRVRSNNKKCDFMHLEFLTLFSCHFFFYSRFRKGDNNWF